MKTSHNWLADYVDIPWPAKQLADELTMAGLEVEAIDKLGDLADSIVVARILDRRPHPDADKLSVCQVDDGTGAPLQVVCGAPNCDAGTTIAFARIGTVFATEKGPFEIKKAKLRGQESYGMICSESELGLSEDHSGIMTLQTAAPLGTPLGQALRCSDTRVEWEVTPNRPDWLSHLGIAREISAITGNPLRRPAVDLTPWTAAGPDVVSLASVEVRDPELCPRYTARVIRGVTIGPSPDWLQARLQAIGLRPINNVVDITNFVLMECGQPLHAFDYDLLTDHRIIVRRAAAGEPMTTLDGQEWKLTTDHLLIADAARGVALAGVMGGSNSEIHPGTTTVLLESAAFQPANIRATSRGLGLISDSSYRFERGVDIEQVAWASARACQLICELAGGQLVPGIIDVRAADYAAPHVSCRYAMINRLLGVDVAPERVRQIMARLDLAVVESESDARQVTVAIPSFRLDLQREVDLIEEVARLYGLNDIPTRHGAAIVGGVRAEDAGYPVEALRSALLGLGLSECYHYTLMGESHALAGSDLAAADLIALKNPLSQEYAVLRPSLIPSMLATVAHNIARENHSLRLFELGKAYRAGKPEERMEIAIATTGPRDADVHGAAAVDHYDLRGLLDGLLERQRITGATAQAAAHPAFRAGRCGELRDTHGRHLAHFGEVAKDLTAKMKLRHPLFLAIVQVSALRAAAVPTVRFAGLPAFPATARDVAILADEALAHQDVLQTIHAAKLPNLESVDLFEIYRDPALGAGKKSMAYRLTFRHPERTLNDKEVNKAYTKLRETLENQLPITLR